METNKYIIILVTIILLLLAVSLMTYIRINEKYQDKLDEVNEDWLEESEEWKGFGSGWANWEEECLVQQEKMREFEKTQPRVRTINIC